MLKRSTPSTPLKEPSMADVHAPQVMPSMAMVVVAWVDSLRPASLRCARSGTLGHQGDVESLDAGQVLEAALDGGSACAAGHAADGNGGELCGGAVGLGVVFVGADSWGGEVCGEDLCFEAAVFDDVADLLGGDS